MDCFGGKKKSYNNQYEKEISGLVEKIRLLQGEIKATMSEKEKQSREYERDIMVFAFKEAGWKQEKMKFKEEIKCLKKMLEEKDDKISGMEDELVVGGKMENKNWVFLSSENTAAATVTAAAASFLEEQMKKERMMRDVAVDKWKKLYLAIKTELDDLIQRTYSDGLYWKAEEEDMIEELKMEVKAKDETIEKLKARLAIMEHEEYKRAREFDILRQSLRIMSSNRPNLAFVKHPRN